MRSNVKHGSVVRDIPWTPVSKPLSASRVSVVSTAGLSMKGDAPFDMETEKKRPSWGDPTWRRLRLMVSRTMASTLRVRVIHRAQWR